MPKASLPSRVAATVAAVALLLVATPARALAASARAAADNGEATPVDLTGASDAGAKHVVGSGGGSIVRTIVGLAIVIGVIYGVAWVLRQVKASRAPRATGSGLATLASVPLGSGRSVNLVRAGTDLVLLGVAENGVVPIRTYTEQEAREAGLVDDDGMLILPTEDVDAGRPARRLPKLPRPQLALPSGVKAARAARPRPALGGRGPSPRNPLDTIRSWTVRS
jgi:flagellar protein FliO/FliZ